jgi:hypothetical protein
VSTQPGCPRAARGSIVAFDRNGDGLKQIHIAGSKGLWRFTQQGETFIP